ncbi:glycoside hydrolase family protein [Salix suchowensis]|nr:glycoside hydrolase family protein [Salix suchowensis]
MERWVVNENWTYTADITPFLQSHKQDTTLLVFYGIDTIANILDTCSLGEQPVSQYTYDVSELVRSPLHNDTNITVAFESAWFYGLNVSSRPDAETLPAGLSGDGPAFVPSGIRKPAYLITLPRDPRGHVEIGTPPISPHGDVSSGGSVFIEESSIDIFKVGQSFSVPPNEKADWILNISLALRSPVAHKGATMRLSFPELRLNSRAFSLPAFGGDAGRAFWVGATWRIPDSIPKRWYPHNLGNPQLYNLSVTIDWGWKLPGLQHEDRLSYYPAGSISIFQRRGGTSGITPGILAWSELIFSDALYPINNFMLESIEPEVRQNVRRVNRHPSNVQWAGGNEIEGIVVSANLSQGAPEGNHLLNEVGYIWAVIAMNLIDNSMLPISRCPIYAVTSETKSILPIERYNYDAAVAFDYHTFPLSRFVNEFG